MLEDGIGCRRLVYFRSRIEQRACFYFFDLTDALAFVPTIVFSFSWDWSFNRNIGILIDFLLHLSRSNRLLRDKVIDRSYPFMNLQRLILFLLLLF